MAYDCRLQTPFNCLIAGPTKSGKTTFTCNLLKVSDDMFVRKPDYVLLFYMMDQANYEHMFQKGLIHEMINLNDHNVDFNEIHQKVLPYKDRNGSLIIFDDSMSDIKPGFEKIFTILGHHTNTSLIFLSQNLFYSNKTYRNMSLNFGYLVLMPNKRDLSQIKYFAYQLCPDNPNYVKEAYYHATRKPYGYLFADCNPNSPEVLSLRTGLFPIQHPDQEPYTVYIKPQSVF